MYSLFNFIFFIRWAKQPNFWKSDLFTAGESKVHRNCLLLAVIWQNSKASCLLLAIADLSYLLLPVAHKKKNCGCKRQMEALIVSSSSTRRVFGDDKKVYKQKGCRSDKELKEAIKSVTGQLLSLKAWLLGKPLPAYLRLNRFKFLWLWAAAPEKQWCQNVKATNVERCAFKIQEIEMHCNRRNCSSDKQPNYSTHWRSGARS